MMLLIRDLISHRSFKLQTVGACVYRLPASGLFTIHCYQAWLMCDRAQLLRFKKNTATITKILLERHGQFLSSLL